MFGSLVKGIDSLIEGVIEAVYFMRGGITYDEMMMRTPGERQRISNFLKTRVEQEMKKPHPNY